MIATQEITASEAIDILAEKFGKDSYKIKSLRLDLAKFEAQDVLERFRELHSNAWWGYGEELVIKTSRSFKDRKEAMAWITSLELGEPEFEKTSFCDSEGSPQTECTLTVKAEFEGLPYEVQATYTRPGMSTAHCKVVPRTSYSVVCDLPK